MANPIAEAFVRLRPDLSTFQGETVGGINRSLGGITVPATTQRQLGSPLFGPTFQQSAKTSLAGGIDNAVSGSGGDAAGRTLAQKLFGPGFRNEAGRGIQGALVGLGGGQLAAQFAFFGAGGAAAAVLGGGLVKATQSAIAFEQQLAILQATTRATSEDMKRFGQAAQNLGRDLSLPGVTANDAAVAMTELAKAGLSVDDAIEGARGTIELAVAAQISVGDAAQIAAAGLNAFGLAGDQAVRVADLLAGASIAAQGDISDMGLSLQQSAAVANQAGLSIDQLVAVITELAKQGILGSDAGTSIRTALLRLVPTTKEAAKFMGELGIKIDDTLTIGQQLPQLIEQYRSSLSALNPTLRQAVLQQIFGTDAIRAATIIFGQGAAGLADTSREISRSGQAAELAAAKSKGAAGAVADLKSEAQTLGLVVGKSTAPAVELLAEDFATLIGFANKAADALGRVTGISLGPLGDVGSVLGKIFAVQIGGPALAGLTAIRLGVDALGDSATASEADFNSLKESAVGAVDELNAALTRAGERFRLADTLGLTGPELRRITHTVRTEGEAAGFTLGATLIKGVGEGITSEEASAIAAARRTLEEVRAEGERQVADAIRSARTNLEQLGSTLSTQLGQIIDLGPIGDRIKELQRQLEALQDSVSKRDLRFDLTQAKRDLREAKLSIAQVGVLSPTQKRAQQEFLDPFQQKVADAKSALKEFSLNEAIQQQEKLKDAAKKTAEEGLAKLVLGFQEGKVSAEEFNRVLSNQLAPALNTIARKNLGLTIEENFLRQVEALRKQAEALSGFLGTAGTAPGPTVIQPARTQAEVFTRIDKAQRDLVEVTKKAHQTSKETLDEQKIQTSLLRRMVGLLSGGTVKTYDPGRPG